MLIPVKAAIAAILVASAQLLAGAYAQQGSSAEPLSATEVRKAEAQAATAADHLRLADWYHSQALQTQTQLKEAEGEVEYWSRKPEIVALTKIPNPYWSARAWARIYREKLEKATKLAASHLKMAESLQPGGSSAQ